MRLGILGGSFDPPHVGHLLAASDACEELKLDRLIFVPAAEQPLKRGGAQANAVDRLAMLHFAVDGDPRFGVSSVEIDRKGLSYTVDTLQTFATEYPDAERYFLIGADAFALFGQWREPGRVAALARVAVMRRPLSAGVAEPKVPEGIAPDRVVWLATRLVDVSSTEIRDRVRRGVSIRGFVPAAVEDYIATARLYRQGTEC